MTIIQKKSGVFLLLLSTASMVIGCVKNDDTTAATPTFTPATDVIFSYTHADNLYTTYKLDWIEKNGSTYTIKANQISVTPSSGLNSPTFSAAYVLIVDASSTGRLLVYSRSSLALVGQINVGSYPQDMVINGNTAYIAEGSGLVKRVDITNLPTLTALSDISVGAKPTVLRKWGNKIYAGNQDWSAKIQASVSVIDPSSNTVTTTINTGPNNMDIAYDGARIWTQNVDWYNASFVCQNAATLTYAPVSTYVPVTVSLPAGYSTSSNCAKGGIAFNNNSGFAALRHTSGNFHLMSISGTTLNSTPIDSTNQYKFVGAGSNYLYKIHNGNGSTANLTTIIEDMSGNILTTQTLTKDTGSMYFFANQ